MKASAVLKRPINEVVPTTNHLEAFNDVLKRKHLRRWHNNGHKLRLDVLVHILVFHALPSIFRQRGIEDRESQRQVALLRKLPGGNTFLQAQEASEPSTTQPVAYWTADDERNLAARTLIEHKQISVPSHDEIKNAWTFTCYSSFAVEAEAAPLTYSIEFYPDGFATCSCLDFQNRGGACKHMRAAIGRTAVLSSAGIKVPSLWLPSTEEQARQICARRLTLPPPPLPPVIDSLSQSVVLVDEFIKDSTLNTSPEVTVSAQSLNNTDQDDSEDDGLVDLLNADAITEYSGHSTPATFDDGSSEAAASSDVDCVQPIPVDELELPSLRNISGQAINDQTIARTFHDLEKVIPKLEQITQWLKEVHLQPPSPSHPNATKDIDRARSIRSVMSSTTLELDRILREVDNQPLQSNLAPARPATPPSRPATRNVYDLLGASPEPLTQRRKQSYYEH